MPVAGAPSLGLGAWEADSEVMGKSKGPRAHPPLAILSRGPVVHRPGLRLGEGGGGEVGGGARTTRQGCQGGENAPRRQMQPNSTLTSWWPLHSSLTFLYLGRFLCKMGLMNLVS